MLCFDHFLIHVTQTERFCKRLYAVRESQRGKVDVCTISMMCIGNLSLLLNFLFFLCHRESILVQIRTIEYSYTLILVSRLSYESAICMYKSMIFHLINVI